MAARSIEENYYPNHAKSVATLTHNQRRLSSIMALMHEHKWTTAPHDGWAVEKVIIDYANQQIKQVWKKHEAMWRLMISRLLRSIA